MNISNLKRNQFSYFGVIFCILILATTADTEDQCATCESMLTNSQNSSLLSCVSDCETQFVVQNLYQNSNRSKLFACTEACQNTPEIKSKRMCEIENCQLKNSTAAIPLQKCQFDKCQQFFIDYQLFVGEQSELIVPSKCKDVAYSTNQEFATISTDCANEFYTQGAALIDLPNNPLYKQYVNCLQTDCSNIS